MMCKYLLNCFRATKLDGMRTLCYSSKLVDRAGSKRIASYVYSAQDAIQKYGRPVVKNLNCIKFGRISHFVDQVKCGNTHTWAVLDVYSKCDKQGQFWFTANEDKTESGIFHLTQIGPPLAGGRDEGKLWFVDKS